MVRFRPLDAWIDPRGGSIERINIDNGIIAIEVLSLGGIIRSLWTPDRDGARSNIVLGCDSASDYLTQKPILVLLRADMPIALLALNFPTRALTLFLIEIIKITAFTVAKRALIASNGILASSAMACASHY